MTPPHSDPRESNFNAELEPALLNQIRQQLAENSTQLDSKTTERLYQARRKALAHYQRQQSKPALAYVQKIPGAVWVIQGYDFATQHRQGVAILSALALAGLLLMRLWQPGTGPLDLSTQDNPYSALDLEILTATENPEFYAELEFYTWLTTHDNEPAAP